MLHVDKVDSLLTEKLRISATDLKQFRCYKFQLKLHYHFGTFFSFCVVKSNKLGTIDLSKNEPIRGTYHEVDPMGLFNSLQPTDEVPYGHYTRNNMALPFFYTLELITDSDEIIDKIHLKKRWAHPSVSQIDVSHNELHGTIFKPPGPGPFPCIIDIPGINGRLSNSFASILSADGFLVYIFPCFDHEDLPEQMQDVDLEIFSRHIQFVQTLPYCSDKIGLFGVSFGGTIANFLATKHSEISAILTVNCPEAFYEDQDIFDRLISETRIAWEQIPKTIAFRLVGSIDDWMMCGVTNCLNIRDKLLQTGHNVEIDLVPGGHAITVPYFPHTPFAYNKFLNVNLGFGGECTLHTKSQEIVWKKNINFFKKHLGTPPILPDYERDTQIVLPPLERSKL